MARDKAYLVICHHFGKARILPGDSLEEIRQLTESAGGQVMGFVTAAIPHPSPSHFLRAGKLAEVREKAAGLKANLLIFNVDLTPVQARNIETDCGLRAVDRTGLILDIFAKRANSKAGKLQVELAQLEYLLPRLVGFGVIMSRLGGGIGTRGPGEQKLEVDRRKIRARIQHVKKDIEKLQKHRELLRSGRRKKNLFQVALAGYTNAGKSTLLNALTGAGTYVEDKLFATLDPKTRRQSINGRHDILFTDTVGFLRDLPHTLIKAFHATLEEVSEADCLIHVLDVSSSYREAQKKTVEKVLQEIGGDQKPVLLALNKADCLNEEEKRRVQDLFPEGILISAKSKLGLDALFHRLEIILDQRTKSSVIN
ncbi:MAG: GTPase HflX [Candidatus Omnitrophica bacterium]|nr:GTPase HflX [Candidatus Omnitrophota bacterium]